MDYSKYLKQLNEGYNRKPKKNLRESDAGLDVYHDLIDRALANYNGDVDEAVTMAIDEGLIYTSDIFDLADNYLGGTEVLDLFYEDLYGDLYNDVEEKLAEEDDIDESRDSSRNHKSLKESSNDTIDNVGIDFESVTCKDGIIKGKCIVYAKDDTDTVCRFTYDKAKDKVVATGTGFTKDEWATIEEILLDNIHTNKDRFTKKCTESKKKLK